MTPVLLVPGLLTSPRLYSAQLPALWQFGSVTIADNTRGSDMSTIAGQILDTAPPRFALAGLSLGGYLCFEILRRAPERVLRLALLDTAATPDTPEQTRRRRALMAHAEGGRFELVAETLFPHLVHDREDRSLWEVVRVMAQETGVEAFVRQQQAIIGRPDSRPGLARIRCPTLVLVGEHDEITPPERAVEMADGIAGARLVTVPRCGHLSTLEHPSVVTGELVRWMQS